ncbi:MAG: hypothetical protein WAQ25_02660 [Candidatus Saccharimonas sp.]
MNPNAPQPGYQPQSTPPPAPQPAVTPTPLSTHYSVDFLDQIAPSQQKKPVHKFAVLGLIGAVLVMVGVFLVVIMNSGGPNTAEQTKSLQGRIKTLQAVTDVQKKHLKQTALNEANSTLSSALTTMQADLTTLMKAKNIKSSGEAATSASKAEAAYLATLQKKLDDSYQRGTLDRNYASQMTYELTILRSKLQKLSNSANSQSTTAFCTTSIKNINAILLAYSKAGAANP